VAVAAAAHAADDAACAQDQLVVTCLASSDQ
jgi:hypothetical protein